MKYIVNSIELDNPSLPTSSQLLDKTPDIYNFHNVSARGAINHKHKQNNKISQQAAIPVHYQQNCTMAGYKIDNSNNIAATYVHYKTQPFTLM
ncbi:MAG TPA: hypothetical protein PLJ00_11090 [Chitinophagales bacterium]|nr:hypothetical protein [Chitinophagales bacterium]HRH53554.1 hypothetical protein [Chitinophagales bacterium]